MFMMMSIMLLCAIMFLFLKHPLTLGLMLLFQTILISLCTGLISQNYWFSYIFFLIMIGGMLILFIYMTSIASNEKFKFSSNLLMMIISFIFIMMMLNLFDYFFYNLNISLMETFNQFSKETLSKNLNKYFNYPLNMITYMIIIYLFISLIMANKLTMNNKGPLRQKN